jgi:hypothetical protein
MACQGVTVSETLLQTITTKSRFSWEGINDTKVTGGRCNDLKNIFAEKLGEKNRRLLLLLVFAII